MAGYDPHFRRLPFCGCFIFIERTRKYVPLISVKAHTTILANASRTVLTQTFRNPKSDAPLKELVYQFPLYDGVSVVSFTCTVGDRVLHGVVKERQQAKQDYNDAIAKGQTAGLLEQSLSAADVFTSKVGKVPAGEEIRIELTYLNELKHDAEVDGLRFTIPTNISPRYGDDETLAGGNVATGKAGFEVTVDAEMPSGSAIKSIQSPSHPISVQIGFSSKSNSDGNAEPSLQRASASLSLGTTQLDKDFILLVTATKLGDPSAVLETHPTIPNQRALMTTLVPKFNIAADKPEIVFVCDRSGSMISGNRIGNLINALNIFLRSLPVGVKFNVCSFGTKLEFLWPKSKTYSQETLDKATSYVKSFSANFGGTEMYKPIEKTIKERYKDMNLEIFLLTDGEIWDQDKLFGLINDKVAESKGAIRVFTLGIGSGASHALIEGVARAGNGFAQTVADDEKMDKKVVRMLKGALTPHIHDYTLEIKYGGPTKEDSTDDDDFELVEKVQDALIITADEDKKEKKEGGFSQRVISLFDSKFKDDIDASKSPKPDHAQKYDHLPAIDTPRYLQAPSFIPSLFPFNRTTVYVLLSADDDTVSNRVPKSVLLKATSAHGPLELEIPVTVLAEKGETIHQLAARKAVKELEEGRGWVTQAKQSGPKAKLLKDKYEGQFSDIVEREAVRLGVKFQVGGKWCSFVAVQDDGEEIKESQDKLEKEEESEDDDGDVGFCLFDDANPPPPAPAVSMARAAPTALGGAGRMLSLARSVAPSRGGGGGPPGGARFGSAAPPRPMIAQMSQPSNAPGDGFGGAAPYVLAKKARKTSASSNSMVAPAAAAAMPRPPVVPAPMSDTRAGDDMSSVVRGYSMGESKKATTSANDPLQVITSLQTFTGNWSQSEHLEAVTGVSHKKAKEAIEAAGLKYEGKGSADDVLATICAVAFLKKVLSEEKEAWEMIVDKAVMWLEEQLGEDDTEKWEKAVEGLF